MAMAVFGMAVMLGPAVGPTLGGVIVDHWHWSWIFFINLPVGALGLFMVASFVHEDEEIREKNRTLAAAQRKNIDWWGIGLMTVGLTTFQYFLEEGAQNDWFDSHLITAIFLIAIVSIAAFIIRELTAETPAVNLRLFKEPTFASGTLIGGLMFAMLMANMFLLPVFMEEVLGFTATQSGLAMMPRVAVMMVATPIIGRIYNSVSPRIVIAIGVVFVSLGSIDMSHLTLASGQGDVIGAIMVQGVGFSCLFVPLTTVALSKIERYQLADAAGLNSLLRRIGGPIGLAIFTTLLGDHMATARLGLVQQIRSTDPSVLAHVSATAHGMVAHGIDPASAHAAALASLAGDVARQASVLSFEWVFLLAGLLFFLVIPLLVFLKEGRSPTPEAAEAHAEV